MQAPPQLDFLEIACEGRSIHLHLHAFSGSIKADVFPAEGPTSKVKAIVEQLLAIFNIALHGHCLLLHLSRSSEVLPLAGLSARL